MLAPAAGASGSNQDASSQLEALSGTAVSGGGGAMGSLRTTADVSPGVGAPTTDSEADLALISTKKTPCNGASLVLGYLIAYLRTKALLTWKSPSGKKELAPIGTTAHPLGTVAVKTARRLKLGDVEDVIVVSAITVFTNKTIA